MFLYLTSHRSLFPATRTARETSASSFKTKQGYVVVFNTVTVLDSKTSEDVYVILIEVVNKMARKCKINDAHFLSVCLHWPDFLAIPL